jgi:hypothetical protein
VISEGRGHTLPMSPLDPIFLAEIAPFLAIELDLASAAAP